MKVALLGCGLMGRGAGYALATDERVRRLTLVDRDRQRADALARELRTVGARAVVDTCTEIADALPSRDAVAMAMPWPATLAAIAVADAAGVPVASVTRPDYGDLDRVAAVGVGVLTPIGLEPGLTELIAVDLIRQAREYGDRVTAISVFCGNIPETPRGPIGHVAFFGGERPDHLPIAQRPALASVAGTVVQRPRFSGVEHRDIEGVGRLEAYHDGMVPWLLDHPHLQDVDYTQKTLRWPGFASAVTELARLGLLDETPIEVDGSVVVPKRVIERVLAPRLRSGALDRDVVVIEATVSVLRSGRPAMWRGLLIDRFDSVSGLTAIARTTGYPLAEATVLLGEKAITGSGWLKPHLALGETTATRLLQRLQSVGMQWSSRKVAESPDSVVDKAPQPEETVG